MGRILNQGLIFQLLNDKGRGRTGFGFQLSSQEICDALNKAYYTQISTSEISRLKHGARASRSFEPVETFYEAIFAPLPDQLGIGDDEVLSTRIIPFLKAKEAEAEVPAPSCSDYKTYVLSMLSAALLPDAYPEEKKTSSPSGKMDQPLIFSQSFLPEPCFVGRGKEMGDLERALNDKGTAFLTGPGGIGKTALARTYAEKKKEEGAYRTAQLIHAEVEGNDRFLRTLNRAHVSLLPLIQGRNDKERFRILFDLLSACGQDTLLILDGFDRMPDDPGRLTDFLETMSCHILFTGRMRPDLPLPVIPVGGLSEEESKTLFLFYCPLPGDEEESLSPFLNRLGGHPLLTELSARAVKKGSLSIDELSKEGPASWQTLPVTHQGKEGSVRDYLHLLYSSGNFSQEEEDLLSLSVFFGPDGLDRRYLVHTAGIDPVHISTLVEGGWLMEGGPVEAPLLQLSPLVRETVLMNRPTDADRLIPLIRRVLSPYGRRTGNAIEDLSDLMMVEDTPITGELAGFSDRVGDSLLPDQLPSDKDETDALFLALIRAEEAGGHFLHAISFLSAWKKVWEARAEELDESSSWREYRLVQEPEGIIEEHIARLYEEMGEYKEAEKHYMTAERIVSAYTPALQRVRLRLAILYRKEGRDEEAKNLIMETEQHFSISDKWKKIILTEEAIQGLQAYINPPQDMPPDDRAQFALSSGFILYIMVRDLKDRLEKMQKEGADLSKDPDILRQLDLLKDLPEILKALKKSVSLTGQISGRPYAKALLKLGKMELEEKNYQKAEAYLSEGLRTARNARMRGVGDKEMIREAESLTEQLRKVLGK